MYVFPSLGDAFERGFFLPPSSIFRQSILSNFSSCPIPIDKGASLAQVQS